VFSGWRWEVIVSGIVDHHGNTGPGLGQAQTCDGVKPEDIDMVKWRPDNIDIKKKKQNKIWSR
jgi:hypothetical protein